MKPDQFEDLDPGRARERTEMAWIRTAISFAALGGAVLRRTPLVGLAILGMCVLIYLLGRISCPSERAEHPERRGSLLLITLSVTTMALVALVLAVFTDGSPSPTR